MPKVVLDLNDRRPAWALPPWVGEEIREALPDGWTLAVMDTEADGSGDGMVNLSPRLLEIVSDAEIYLGYGVPAALLRAGSALKWVHSGAAGVQGSLTPEMLENPVLFTNSKGIHGPPVGDTALGMILYFARCLDFGVAEKAAGRWNTEPFHRKDHPLVEVAHSCVGIFGFGGVGREVAKRAGALGARVLAYDRGPEAFWVSEASGENLVSPLHGEDGFRRLLAESDFLVLTAPETPQTRGKFDAAALAQMKTSATIINVSRGRLVDEDALVAALSTGRLRGAGLDVFATEPLPEGHPLWTLPNVLITPHVSAVTRQFWRRQTDLILENLGRYFSCRPLLNLVDKAAGF
jgi:phosphoglycerate dehydrogenase-like enzyme